MNEIELKTGILSRFCLAKGLESMFSERCDARFAIFVTALM
jgi:hypothetical protein